MLAFGLNIGVKKGKVFLVSIEYLMDIQSQNL